MAGVYRDDSSITNDTELWRRIPPIWIVADENVGGLRPSSAAFEDGPDGSPMSVYVEQVLKAAGKGAEDVLAGHSGFALASILAGLAREKKQGVAFEDDSLPGHAVVFGKKTRSVSRAFAKGSKWVVAPSPTSSSHTA